MLTLASLLLATALPACVPARWPWPEPASLALLENSPFNCLLVDRAQWSQPFAEAAAARQITVYPTTESAGVLKIYNPSTNAPLAELGLRSSLDLNSKQPLLGTTQGLWPGVKADDQAHARPSSAPWIVTNSGFLRFVRASAAGAPALWIANRPPAGQIISVTRYIQAYSDAAMTGARWLLDLAPDDWQRLKEGNPQALAAWRRLCATAAFFERHRDLALYSDYSRLAVVQDARTGALLSGSILDMIAARHVPSVVVLPEALPQAPDRGLRALLNLDPSLLDDPQRAAVKDVARRGATVLTGPPGWKMELPPPAEITFAPAQVKVLDDIWREVNGLIGRRNFAVRVFGAPSTLSVLKASPDRRRLALFLVNYSDYPVEDISLHLLGPFRSARLLTPRAEAALMPYEVDDGTGFDIPKLDDVAILLLEPQNE